MTTENQATQSSSPETDLGNEQQQTQSNDVTQQTNTQQTSATSSTDLGEDGSQEQTNTDLGAEDEQTDKTADTPPYAEYITPPAEGKYEAFTLPDGFQADEELTNEFTPVANELGLSQKGAQKLVDHYAKIEQKKLERWGGHLKELKALAQKDPEIGGARYPAAVAAGRSVISKFGTPGLRKLMNDYGVGAHPEMIRFMAKIGAAMGETPTPTSGEGGQGVRKDTPLHELMYKD